MKLTTKRQMVYDTLKRAKKPQSADDIYNALGGEKLNLSTIYRTLEIFHQDALVSRNYLDNTAYYYLNEAEHHHFMVCENCHKKYEFDCHIDSLIEEIKSTYGFEVQHHDLNLYGICKNCQG